MSKPRRSNLAQLACLWLVAVQCLSACTATQPPPTSTPAFTPAPAATATPLPTPTPAITKTPAPQSATTLSITAPTGDAPAFSRLELTLTTDGVYANPFDPAQVDLWVQFTSPAGETQSVPAFWYQDFDPNSLTPTGPASWRVRFTPTVSGQWQAQVLLTQPKLQSAPITFTVSDAPAAQGFVRINPNNPRYFAFDNGDLYFPIGLNIGWASSLTQTIPQYKSWFGSLSQNGGNIARLWMPDWGVGIEWNDTGLGNYSKRQEQAWLLDQVFYLAEQDNIYILLSLINHGAFSESVNPEWDQNPYNVANGGPLATPAEFVTNATAKELFKRRLRYIVARWGYSTHLFAWEWWNEENWTPIDDTALRPWIEEMTESLKHYDPYHHLTTTSYADGSNSRIWRSPALDFMQQHDYSGADPIGLFQTRYAAFQSILTKGSKPVLMGEHGYSAAGAATAGNSEAIHLHNGLWAATFEGYAGSSMAWWWDTFVDPQNIWPQYKYLADFIQNEDLAQLTPGKAVVDKNAYALTLTNQNRALIWIRNKQYDAAESGYQLTVAQRNGTPTANWSFEPPTIPTSTLTLKSLADGDYHAYWYAPQTGQWLADTPLTIKGSTAAILIPEFTFDLALKIVGPNEPHTP